MQPASKSSLPVTHRLSLPEVVGEWARAEPHRPAVEDGGFSLTYGELDAAGAAIARELIGAGVRPEEPVAVCLPRSWEAVAAFLGALRAGAAYVPINPEHPPLRQRELVEMVGARFALTGPAHDGGLPSELVRLEAGRLASGGGSDEVAHAEGGERLAYVLFTSGSTGRPKGVEVSHGNLTHMLCSGAEIVPLAEDGVLHVTPLDFDISAFEIWGALLNGARLVIAPAGRPDPARVGALIAKRGVTHFCAATGIFHELVRSALPDLGGLRLVTPGGDVLSPSAVRALRRAHPHVRVFNSYGPTEATITACRFEIHEEDDEPIPLGRPLPGYSVHLLEDDGRPVEPGGTGEIWIGGRGVARGYRGDPVRTDERFRPNRFAPGRMYRTGDLGRWREDGELLFLGRGDRQVKISGQRVELGELEYALRRHPAVDAAAVVAEEAIVGHKRLVAHVVPAAGRELGTAEIHAFLSERVPRALVPSRIRLLSELPLTERGKVDHAALLREAEDRERPMVSGPGGTAERVSELMAELLELDAVGPDENLFELGGDSLLAIALLGLLRERLDVELPIETVFESPTAASLADRIELASRPEHPRPRLAAAPPQRSGPLSFAQRRAWFHCQVNPGSIAYQFGSLLRFTGDLDRRALTSALGDLIGRHEILRTSFVQREDDPVALIHDEVPLPFEEVDLRAAGHRDVAEAIRERVRARIDPAEAPLLRWTLLRLGDEEWGLVHVEHHLVHDGWSFNVLMGEISELYSANVERRRPGLPEPELQFRDYARWEGELVASESVEKQLAYWTRTLDRDAPPLDLPTDRPRGARESFVGGSIRRRLDRADAAALAAVGRAEGATLFMASFAAFAVLLHRLGGAEDLQIGSGVANRTEPAARRLIGMIVNTIVMRVDLSGDPTVAELLRRVRRVALEAYANADAPFDAVVEALAPARDPSRSPLINVLYSFHDSPRSPERWAGLDARLTQALPNGSAKADLNVIGIDEGDGGITFVWEHSDLFEDTTAGRLAEQHLELMAQFVRRPDARLSELELAADRSGLAAEHVIRGPSVEYERDSSVVGVFRDRVRERPESIALDLEGARLSYAELDGRSDLIARALVARGVRPGDRVGLLARRSLDCYSALLAVLKAGAAYVAFEPHWPAARIAQIAGNAGLGLVIAEEALTGRVPEGTRVLVLDGPLDDPGGALPDSLDAMSAAYVAYTSGSTGDPKGVEVPHRAVVRLVRGQDWVRLGPDQTLLAAAPVAFDASTFEIWGALLNGARLAIFPPEPPTADAIDEVIRRQRVTTLWLTAGLFHRFVDLELDTLRWVGQLIAGGDVLSPEHVRRALELMRPGAVLINGYGPTEATTFTCTHPLPARTLLDEEPVPIGLPLANTQVVVVDDQGRSLPAGSVGELWIGGDGVASGYLGDPILSADRFVPDPLTGGRLYRSGDLVRARADGTIEFLGRRDRQVKIRGHRVEPAEVERTLSAHPDVSEAVVEAESDADGQSRLVAYCVHRSRSADWRALRAWASERLPAAFVPSRWHELTELPLTANGKIDRSRLRELAEPSRRPRRLRRRGDPLEERLCGIWRSVLELDAVTPEDDFFELGGHSLLAVSLFGEIDRRLGVELPLATLFEAPTPAALADRIRAGGWRESWAPVVALREAGSRPPFFCVTAGDGNAVGFAALARRLDREQPFHALQLPGLDGQSRIPPTVEAMTDRYLPEIRRIAPHGPYLLGGRCLGSKVALEIAQRLHADGERVALLAVIDDLEGPVALDITLPTGVPYGEALSKLRERAREDGVPVDDIYAPAGAAALMAYAREPVVGEVPRLLHEVWRGDADVREAFPDIENGDGPRLIDWGWQYGRDLAELPEEVLPAPSNPELLERSPESRGVRERLRARASVLEERIDVAARGRLPGARERREARRRRITVSANESYRARPYPGRITHLASAERARELTARRWHDIARGGVEEHVVQASHRSMLRVPGVAELARTLESCIQRALR